MKGSKVMNSFAGKIGKARKKIQGGLIFIDRAQKEHAEGISRRGPKLSPEGKKISNQQDSNSRGREPGLRVRVKESI